MRYLKEESHEIIGFPPLKVSFSSSLASDELRSAYLTIAEHYAWTYDNLGRLSSDGRNGAEPIRTAYSYNIRSWQTGVSSGVFSEELHYTDPSACGASSAPQFNGSISSSVWSLSGGLRKGYGYSYDGLGRVTGAEWLLGGRPASGYGTSYSYDSHGNILSLSRERGSVPDEGDDLMMAYSGNRLHAMSDHGGSMIPDHLAGSIPSGMTQYAYDANGNMTRDLNSGLTVMSYNRLNLPDELTCVGSDGVLSIRYLYASDGRKLRVSTSGPGGSSSVTDYASNVVYRDGSLDRILIPGGYMTDGSYRFFMTDHLGSIRAVTDSEGNVLEAYDYYPYGVEFPDGAASGSGVAVGGDADAAASDVVAVQSGVSDGATGSGAVPDGLGVTIQPYRFNGKESQEVAGLPYLDYGARYYHPLSSRWTTMDPLAEKYYSVSPYAFCSGNPVNFVDPDGMVVIPKGTDELNIIRNTIPESDREYVQLNANGQIDASLLSGHESSSGNYQLLKELVTSDLMINVELVSAKEAQDNDGNAYVENLSYSGVDEYFVDSEIQATSGLSTGETGKYGLSLLPGKGSSGVNSPNDNIYVIIHPSLSEVGRSEVYSHEANGHVIIYNRTRDRKASEHQPVGMTENNIVLKELILQSRKETISNINGK